MQIFRADMLIDGSGGEPRLDVEIFVEDGRIRDVAPAGTRQRPPDADGLRPSPVPRSCPG